MANGQAGYAILENRGVLAVGGEDRATFLQGLVSNDVRRTAEGQALYSLFLTPQGKYLHDFFLVESGDALLLDAEAARREDLLRRLKMYRLRSKVALEDRADRLSVAVVFGDGALEHLGLPAAAGAALAFGGGMAFTDPRMPDLGARAILPSDDAVPVLEAAGLVRRTAEDYDRLRLTLGVPDGSRDLIPEKAIALENDLDDLNAISWDKGCYVGQELTARTKYRALIKKKLFPVTLDGPVPEPGTPVTLDGREIGEIRSGRDGLALALLRLEDLARAQQEQLALKAGDIIVTAHKPSWATF
jgi:folate-binding protein YgfZ